MITEIERIYINKKGLNLKNMTLEERMKLSKMAYEWAFEKRKNYIGNLLEDKESFLIYLEDSDD